ncbi:hypothetical protein WMY93_011530 [Mugilogobius chulae]|uniref:DNA-directed DNA polymerase n=1 Tax=Mugilogobius chulae TaxID=88201 RepID=A0AAW0P6R4_9GOBI
MYGADEMSPKQREEFFNWYQTVKDQEFDYDAELQAYCENDVQILAEGFTNFRDEFIKTSGCDPTDSVTIASAALSVFQTQFLKPNTIAIPCPNNYKTTNKAFSHAAIQWLEFERTSRNIPIRHAMNGGEVKVGRYFVDGYAEVGGAVIIFSFLGCFFHGCDLCFNPHERSPLAKRSFGELYADTMERIAQLQTMTDSVVHITEAFCLRYITGPNEGVGYADVTSLYPYVNAFFYYPVGHPKIIRENFDAIENYFGLICAKVYPPRKLFSPVLPFRNEDGKLIFTLCRTCAIENNQISACTHDDEGRAIQGEWTTPEVMMALNKGYVMHEIYEVWHFEEKSDTLFKDYIFTFLKQKQEASGYPPDVVDPESKRAYINDYKEKQGIVLDPRKLPTTPLKDR